MKLTMERDAKVYVDPKTGEEVHKLGYAMALFLYGVSKLKPGEPMPEGIISPTGDGKIPGMRKHLAADAMLIGYAEARGRAADGSVEVGLSPSGVKAATNHEVVGVKPPRPLSFLYRTMDRLIEEQRRQRQAERTERAAQRTERSARRQTA